MAARALAVWAAAMSRKAATVALGNKAILGSTGRRVDLTLVLTDLSAKLIELMGSAQQRADVLMPDIYVDLGINLFDL